MRRRTGNGRAAAFITMNKMLGCMELWLSQKTKMKKEGSMSSLEDKEERVRQFEKNKDTNENIIDPANDNIRHLNVVLEKMGEEKIDEIQRLDYDRREHMKAEMDVTMSKFAANDRETINAWVNSGAIYRLQRNVDRMVRGLGREEDEERRREGSKIAEGEGAQREGGEERGEETRDTEREIERVQEKDASVDSSQRSVGWVWPDNLLILEFRTAQFG